MKLLIVDDEELIRNVVKEYALLDGYSVDEAQNGEEALDKVTNTNYDCIVMDIMMPVMDGVIAAKKTREIKDIPIIMLSARSEESDILSSFGIGADDYVTKPFSPKELMARVKAVTKRNNRLDKINVGSIVLDKTSREVTIDNKLIELTHTQFEMLSLFLSNINRVLTRESIINSIWGYDYDADDRTIDAHIKLLRSKIGKYRDSIITVRKVGYKFEYKEK